MPSHLKFSELSNTVYIVDSKGKKTDITGSFLQIVLLWGCDGKLIPEGTETTKQLTNNGEVHWEITIKRSNPKAI